MLFETKEAKATFINYGIKHNLKLSEISLSPFLDFAPQFSHIFNPTLLTFEFLSYRTLLCLSPKPNPKRVISDDKLVIFFLRISAELLSLSNVEGIPKYRLTVKFRCQLLICGHSDIKCLGDRHFQQIYESKDGLGLNIRECSYSL